MAAKLKNKPWKDKAALQVSELPPKQNPALSKGRQQNLTTQNVKFTMSNTQ